MCSPIAWSRSPSPGRRARDRTPGVTGASPLRLPDPATLTPRARIERSLPIVGPAVAGAAALVAIAPWASWTIFAFGWLLIPAFAMFASGAVELGREAVATASARLAAAGASTRENASTAAEAALLIARLRLAAASAEASERRDRIERVADAAERVAAEMPPGAAGRAVLDRVLTPAAASLIDDGLATTEGSPHPLPTDARFGASSEPTT